VTFASTTTNTVPGFNKVYRGITFKNYSTSTRYTNTNTDVVLHGLHDQLDRTYPRRDQDEPITGNWTFNNDKMLQFGTAGQSKIQFQSLTGNLLIDNPTSGNTLTLGAGGFNLSYNGGSLAPNNPNIQDLGSASKRFNNVYTKNLNAGSSAQTGALVGTWNLSQDSKLTPYGDGANSLGTDTLRFGDVYTFGLSSAGDTGTITGNWQIAHDNTLFSELDLAVDLGKTNKRFGTVFTGALSSGNSTATMYVTGDLSVDGSISPKINAGSDLGTSTKRWGNVYSRDTNASNAVIGKLTATIATLFDSVSNTITQFDADPTLAANSDARLPTQKAVKGYADTINNTLLTLINLVQTTLQDEINALQFVPVSAVFHVARSVCPAGFLVCDGTSYPTSAYPELFSAIGYTYGGSGNSFKVPDLRGQFVRGFNAGSDVDPGRLFGSTQPASVESHLHNIDTLFGTQDDRGPPVYDRNGTAFQPYNQWGNDNDGDTGNPVFFAGTTYNAGGAETRPTNVAMLPIIKY
jgi:microcystin-dependent protein